MKKSYLVGFDNDGEAGKLLAMVITSFIGGTIFWTSLFHILARL